MKRDLEEATGSAVELDPDADWDAVTDVEADVDWDVDRDVVTDRDLEGDRDREGAWAGDREETLDRNKLRVIHPDSDGIQHPDSDGIQHPDSDGTQHPDSARKSGNGCSPDQDHVRTMS